MVRSAAAPATDSASARRDRTRLGGLALALIAILGYTAVGNRYYDGYQVAQGSAMYHLLPDELSHLFLFAVFGIVALCGLVVALDGLQPLAALVTRIDRSSCRPPIVAVALACSTGLVSAAVAHGVLRHAVITDDEHVYRFIAETIRTGAVTAPSPGTDLAFFREQFVVLNERVRYGKYPLGFPLLLAAGQALGAEALVVPIVTGALFLPLAAIGVLAFGRGTAILGSLLAACSPQVLLTGATALSQPASALALLTGLAALLKARDSPRVHWLLLSGTAFGYGVLVRPLPGLLFATAAGCIVALDTDQAATLRRRLGRAASFGLPCAALAALVLLVNKLQSGVFLSSGYQEFHTPGQGAASIFLSMGGGLADRVMSVVGAVLRLSAWMSGWPFAFLLCALARPCRNARVIWAMIAAAAAYRLVAPKVGVGGAGPLYVFEVVPLLCLLAANGVLRLAQAGTRVGSIRFARSTVAALLIAGLVVNVSMFLPGRLVQLRRMGAAQRAVEELVAAEGISRALVFYDTVVPPRHAITWAYYARCNSPSLDDDVLFLRLTRSPTPELNREMWLRRFPDRSAWVFVWLPPERARLVPLHTYLDAIPQGPGA